MIQPKPPCVTLPQWLRGNLGKRALAPLTSTDYRALLAAVMIVEAWSYDRCEENVRAFRSVVSRMHSGHDEYVRDGDIAIIDRSIVPRHGHVVVATIDNESCVKMFCRRGGRTWLASANPKYPDIEIADESEVVIEGVVTYTIHQHAGART